MRYKVITRSLLKELEKEVEQHLNDGWECQGGICIDDADLFYQAMIKKE